MSSTRTQVYLTEEQRRKVDQLADAEGVTMAVIIRRALDERPLSSQAGIGCTTRS